MTIDRRRFALLLATSVVAVHAFATGERAKPEEAKALLAKAVAHIKAVGRDKAYAEFMAKPGPWIDRDLYVTVYDFTGKTLVHGANPRLVGKDNLNLQDANGKFHVKERLVGEAGTTMSDIVASVQRVSDVIAEISHAAREQTDGIQQIDGTIHHLDQMTQQNAALVEQSAAAAESMREQSAHLAHAVSAFHLDGGAQAGVGRPRA